MEFNKHKLGEFIDTISETSTIKKQQVVLINTSDVENGKVLNHKYTENKNLKGQFKKRFRKDDILYSEIRPKNKRFAYVDFDASDYIASTKLMVLRNKGNIDNTFLYQLLKSNKIINQLQLLAESRSGTFPQITFNELANVEIEIPNIENQIKISKILTDIDSKIEINNQTNDNLYEITNKLYEQLFVIERQDDWKEYNIQELMDISNGYSYTGKELVDTSVVGMATIKNFERTGGFKEEGFKDIEPIKAKDIHYADKFDILVACTDLTQNADIIGNAIMLLNIGKYEKVVISMDLVKILPKKNKYLVFSILNSKEFKNFALGYKTGTTVLHLNKNCFKDFHIKLPDFDKIENFEKVVETNYKKISYNLEENNTLTQLRDSLLPKLMSGEIDLDKIENY